MSNSTSVQGGIAHSALGESAVQYREGLDGLAELQYIFWKDPTSADSSHQTNCIHHF
jgi:hypothetical protein